MLHQQQVMNTLPRVQVRYVIKENFVSMIYFRIRTNKKLFQASSIIHQIPVGTRALQKGPEQIFLDTTSLNFISIEICFSAARRSGRRMALLLSDQPLTSDNAGDKWLGICGPCSEGEIRNRNINGCVTFPSTFFDTSSGSTFNAFFDE